MDYLAVVIATLFIGGFSIPIGLLLGLSPLAVYVTATLTSLCYAAGVLGAGGPVRDWVVQRFGHEGAESNDDGRPAACSSGGVSPAWRSSAAGSSGRRSR